MTDARRARWALIAAPVAAAVLTMPASQAQIAVQNQGYIPYSDAPIFYRSNDINDPVAALEREIRAGRQQLAYEEGHGYLRSVLKLLDVPVESQTLVFSKTSFQYPKINPEHPRALYYNDDVYVGAVHEGKAIEIVSFDARQGAIFYLLDERKAAKPSFERAELDCTQCHIAGGTRGVPGVLLRSVYPTASGTLVPGAPQLITDQESPLSARWGGWYVNGLPAGLSQANATTADTGDSSAGPDAPAAAVSAPVPASALHLTALAKTYDAAAYLTPGSDPVALLVLAHQTQMHNLITLTNYKTRQALYSLAQRAAEDKPQAGAGAAPAPAAAPVSLESLPEATRRQIERPANQLVRYLLFAGEASLAGTDSQALAKSSFARGFAARGERDPQGRSLRDFDLHTRIFRYPCSYLIYSAAFDALPEPARGYVYHRLLQVLTGAEAGADFAALSGADRQAILEILLATKHGLPAEWQAYASAHQLHVSGSGAAVTRR